VTCCVTHPILTKGKTTALERLMTAKIGTDYVIDNLVMTDSIPEAAEKVEAFAKQYPEQAKKIEIIPLGPAILAEVKRQMGSAAAPAKKIKPDNKNCG
jgi:phosphoribosylpyrophosphate synthetase